MEKIRDPKVRHATLDHLHTVMFKSINPDETIKSSRHMGGKWWRILITYNLVLLRQDFLGPIIANSISNLLLSKYGMFLSLLIMDPLQVACWLFTHTQISSWVVSMLCMSMQNFWTVGLHQMSHSNQDTQVSIEFYHGAVNCWFSFETKGLKGCCIN